MAERDLRRYRRRGADKITKLLLTELRRWPLQDASLLDVGGGIGVIGMELAASGASSATVVEASPTYFEVARSEVESRHGSRPTQFVLGDFVAIAPTLPDADVVTLGRRRPGYLLQGLTCCERCGYAYYGKTTHQMGAGHQMKDFRYYRCSGTDGYRFGGERICNNAQMQGEFLETAVWYEVCELLTHPERLEHECEDGGRVGASLERVETLKAQRLKLQHALERLIDTFTEGPIEKDQFTSRMTRTKSRIAELDTKIKDDAGEVDQLEHLRLTAKRLRDLAAAVGPHMADADWHRRRDIIRTLVQRIEIGPEVLKIVFRVTPDARGSGPESVVVTLPRM